MTLRCCLLALLLCPSLCLGDIKTGSDFLYGDGRFSSNFFRVVHDNTYLSGLVGNWSGGEGREPSILTGFLVGYQSSGDVFLDMAIGSYEELVKPTLQLNRYLPAAMPTMGTLSIGMRVTEAITVGLGGVYLRQQERLSPDDGDRLLGKASLKIDLF